MAKLRVIAGGGAEAKSLGPASPLPGARGSEMHGLLRELYERHAPAVFARCRYLLRNDEAAKDALHDVFTKVLQALPEFRSAASPITWLTRIATNHCLNLIRAERANWREAVKHAALAQAEASAKAPTALSSVEGRELVRALLAAAEPEAQEMAVFYFVDEMTQAEIAEATGRSLPTVRKRLREFLTAARAALAEAVPGLNLPEGDEL